MRSVRSALCCLAVLWCLAGWGCTEGGGGAADAGLGADRGEGGGGPGDTGPGPGDTGPGPGDTGPGPGDTGPGPGDTGPGDTGPGPGDLGPSPGDLGPSPGDAGPGPGDAGPGPGDLGGDGGAPECNAALPCDEGFECAGGSCVPVEAPPVPCAAGDLTPPCNGCPAGTVVPPGFVCAPAGTFTQGREGWGEGTRQMTLTRHFFIQTTEVTQGEWRALLGYNPADFQACGDTCPVEMVNWNDMLAFANAKSAAEGLAPCYDLWGALVGGSTPYECTGYRLPTEAEWEYAYRAGTQTVFYWGDAEADAHANAWLFDNAGNRTHPVGTRRPNAWGLHDMAGNVWEFVHDLYIELPDGATTDHWAAFGLGDSRVVRGGSWFNTVDVLRADLRYWNPPGPRFNVLGFRLARSGTLGGDGGDSGGPECSAARPCDQGFECQGGSCVPSEAPDGSCVAGDQTPPCNGCPAGTVVPPGFACAPAGMFTQGEAGWTNRTRQVTLTRHFFIQRTETTQGEWRTLMGNNPASFWDLDGTNPVETVSWLEATAYANARSAAEGLAPCYDAQGGLVGDGTPYACTGYRLPTEAEWEYAYRAGTQTPFYWGDAQADAGPYAWFSFNSRARHDPVGTKLPNAWGLYDMAGNVWEWVHDGAAFYPDGAATDPWGPRVAENRVSRGGSWDDPASLIRAAVRSGDQPDNRSFFLGFRLARSAARWSLGRRPSGHPGPREVRGRRGGTSQRGSAEWISSRAGRCAPGPRRRAQPTAGVVELRRGQGWCEGNAGPGDAAAGAAGGHLRRPAQRTVRV